MHKPPLATNRSTPTSVRPRATKHLYRPASADHVVRHLGSSMSRSKPFFVFAGKGTCVCFYTDLYGFKIEKGLSMSTEFTRMIKLKQVCGDE